MRFRAALNAGVGIAFLIALLLSGTRLSFVIPYVDPVLLTILVLVLVWVPAKTVKDNVLELRADRARFRGER